MPQEVRISSEYLAQLRLNLTNRLNAEELHRLYSLLGVDYDDFPGQDQAEKARELVAYLQHRNRIPELVQIASQLRPDTSWGNMAQPTEQTLQAASAMSSSPPPPGTVFVLPTADQYGGLKLRPVRDMNVAGQAIFSGRPLTVMQGPVTEGDTSWVLVRTQSADDIAGWACVQSGGAIYIGDKPDVTTPTTIGPITPPTRTVYVQPDADKYGGLKLRAARDTNLGGPAAPSGTALNVVAEPAGDDSHEWLLVTAQDGKDTAGWVHTRQAGEVYVRDTQSEGVAPVSFALTEAADLWVIATAGLLLRTHRDVPAGPGSPTASFGQHLTTLDSESAPDDKGRTWIQIRTDDGLVGWVPASENGEPYLSNIQPYSVQVLDTQPVRDAGGLRIRDQRGIGATVVDTLQIGQRLDVYYRVVESDGTPWLWVKSPNNKYGWAREKSGDVTFVGEAGEVSQPAPTAVPTPETPSTDKPESAPPPPDLGGTMTGTNQAVINAFFSAASEVSQDSWDWLKRAGLADLVNARNAPYTGPAIDLLPNLTDDEKARIKAKLPPPQPEPTPAPQPPLDTQAPEALPATPPPTGEAKEPAQPEPTATPTPEPTPPPPPELISPYGEPDGPRQRFSEVMAGLSFSVAGRPTRTITAVVTDRTDKQPRLLLAGDIFSKGMKVDQPGPVSGGSKNTIGAIENQVVAATCVAAVARLDGERPFLSKLPHDQPVASVTAPRLRLGVCKFGGETGYTTGTINQIETGFSPVYAGRQVSLRDGFIVQEPEFSRPGDIGALVLTETNQAVGVIVVQTEGLGTVCLPIQPILDQLGVSLVTEPVRYIPSQPTTDQLAASRDLPGGEDQLGFTQYREAFVRLIKGTEPPLTIGIYGAWGTGKSFLMDMIAKQLRTPGRPTLWHRFFSWFIPALCKFLGDPALWKEISAQVDKQADADVKKIQKRTFWQWLLSPPNTQVLTVWYDAWDYNSSDKLWAGLVERIFRCIEYSGLGWYGQIRINLKRNVEREWDRLRHRLLPYAFILIVFLALTAGFVLTNQATWAALVGGSTALALMVSLARQWVALLSTPASRRIVDLFAAPDYTSDLGFMGRIKLDLEGFANSLPDKMKVVIFIDDLDRCDAKKAVEVLEAVKLLLDMERFIVFLALDARIITQEVEEHYGKVLVDAEITGYEYLDKIVQIPFSIPDAPPDELYGYLGSLMGITKWTDLPSIEVIAARRMQAIKERLPTHVAQRDEKALPSAPEPTTQAPVTGGPGQQPPPTTAPQPTGPISGEQGQTPPQSTASPPPKVEERKEEVDLGKVTFNQKEQEAFLGFYADLDPNPRRIKRLVNIYQLVRALISSRPKPQGADSASWPDLLDPPHHVMGWLILCEQWPYAAHMLLEEFDRQSPKLSGRLSDIPIATLYEAAKRRIALEDNKALKKLDLKHDLLESFITAHLGKFTLEDLRRLRPFTVNFNPALSAEVRLTLASERS